MGNNMKYFRKISPLLLAIGLMYGCASSNDARVSAIGDLGDISIVPGSIQQRMGTNSLLQAQAVLHNNGSKAITGFYRCKFTTPSGMQVGDDQIWQQVTIYPNSDQGVKCLATDREATKFTLEFSADGKNVNSFQ